MPYHDVKHELADMLSPFRLADSAPNPANPRSALRSTEWWEVFPPILTDYKEADDLNTIAGLKQPIYDLIVEDPPGPRKPWKPSPPSSETVPIYRT
jgi:hypothetical protein